MDQREFEKLLAEVVRLVKTKKLHDQLLKLHKQVGNDGPS